MDQLEARSAAAHMRSLPKKKALEVAQTLEGGLQAAKQLVRVLQNLWEVGEVVRSSFVQ